MFNLKELFQSILKFRIESALSQKAGTPSRRIRPHNTHGTKKCGKTNAPRYHHTPIGPPRRGRATGTLSLAALDECVAARLRGLSYDDLANTLQLAQTYPHCKRLQRELARQEKIILEAFREGQ